MFFERRFDSGLALFVKEKPESVPESVQKIISGFLWRKIQTGVKTGQTGVKTGKTGVKTGQTGVKTGKTGVKPESVFSIKSYINQ
ncbi:hypothetical protein ATQ08_09400 [Salmonella enterica]|nr:hypothetical protein [Salmonella enterica]